MSKEIKKLIASVLVCTAFTMVPTNYTFADETTTKAEETEDKKDTKEEDKKDTKSDENEDYDPLEFYSKDNPKKYSLNPIAPDLDSLEDKSDEGMDEYKEKFEKYLKEKYPDHEWKVMNVQNGESKGKKFVRGEAFSTTSMDTIIWVFDQDDKITDTFTRDVVERLTTLSRWKLEFRPIVDNITTKFYKTADIAVDVNYEIYRENISKVKLDQPLDPMATEYTRCLDMYLKVGLVDPDKVYEMTDKVIKELKAEGIEVNEYYLFMYRQENSKTYKFFFKIPKELIGTKEYKEELRKAMENPNNKGNKILPLKGNGEEIKK